ncbi:hypothetical protein JCM8547_006301 [Rhodosporidiobolus lusitaniae]
MADPSPTLSFVSSDGNVSIRGELVSRPRGEEGKEGTVEGLVLKVEEGEIEVKHPALVSVSTKPESQTLFSINTGERLFTLATPMLPESPSPANEGEEGGDVFEDDDDEDVEDFSLSSSSSAPPKPKSSQKPTSKPSLITLHAALLPLSSLPELQSSPLFSQTFSILIDGPSFPPPHFDPSSIVPPTPSVKPYTYDPNNPPTSISQHAFAGGVLNSPTLQRALLSPLLSPQRRASAHGASGAADVPPLSLGLSRTSRPSFSGDRPSSGLKPYPSHPSSSSSKPPGLTTLVPSLAPPPPDAPAPLQTTLTSSLSTAAKKTAEEILALRRSHDVFVRRAKAELEVLEARVEEYRRKGFAGERGTEQGVVRGFRTKEGEGEKGEGEKAKVEQEQRKASTSRGRGRSTAKEEHQRSLSRDAARGASTSTNGGTGSAGASQERERDGADRGRPSRSAGAPPTPVMKATDMDEDLSSRMRAADEREEEERGRSRSRIRRGGVGEERRSESRSGSKMEATMKEATRKAVEGAIERGKSASRDRGRESEGEERGGREGERREPRKGENIPATLEEEDEEEEEEKPSATADKRKDNAGPPAPSHSASASSTAASTTSSAPSSSPTMTNSLLSPPPLSASVQSTSSTAPSSRPAHSGGATPTFIPSSKALIAVPEEEELSLPPSRAESEHEFSRGRGGFERQQQQGEKGKERKRNATECREEGEADQPFEMDEDVDASSDSHNLLSPRLEAHEPSQADLDLDLSSARSPPPPQPSSSFRTGSFQRASALSASYAALLSSSTARGQPSPSSPSVTAIYSFGSPATASRAADGLPPFSPPDAKTPMTTSAREDAQTALSASILERTQGVGAGKNGVQGPDPRAVRRGEQKIRDVLAMDVPSHRPRAGLGRRASVSNAPERTYTPDADSPASSDDDEEDEAADRVEDLTTSMASLRSPSTAKMHVGSLPIALGRPSTLNAARSSWRPDPERLWAQEREKELRKNGGAGGGAAGFLISAKPASVAAPQAMGWSGGTQPLEIGSGAAGGRNGGGGREGGGGGGVASSLAQSLRAAPASFSARAEAEQRFSAMRNGRSERVEEGREEDGEDQDEEGEDDDGAFVPPHMVAERRRARDDEQYLSRSVSKS